jgi:hypothetical protein
MTSGEAFARLLTVASTWADAGELVGRVRDVQVLGWELLDLGADTELKKPLLQQLFAACSVNPAAVKFTPEELQRTAPFGPKVYGRLNRPAV